MRCTHVSLVGERRIDAVALAEIQFVFLARRAGAAFAQLLGGGGGFDLEPELARLRQQRGILRLHPVGDGDVDVGFAGPRLVFHGFDDRAGLDDVVESADAGLVVADVLRADEAGAAGHGVGGGAGRQVVVRFAKPIDAVVGHAGHVRVGAADGVDVVRAALGLEHLGAEERRVADDDVGLGPVAPAGRRA